MWSFKSANPDRLLVRGIISILIGAGIIAYPGLTLVNVIRIIGTLMLLDGVVAYLMNHFSKKQQGHKYILLPRGTSNVIFGAFLLVFPTLMVNAFVFIIGLILLFAGITQVTTQFGLPKTMKTSWLMLSFAVISTVAGVVMLTRPFESAQTMLIIFGSIVSLYGVGEVFWSFKIRKFKKQQIPDEPQVVDAEYEEIK